MMHQPLACLLTLFCSSMLISPALASIPTTEQSPSAIRISQNRAAPTAELPAFQTETYEVRVFTQNDQPLTPGTPLFLNLTDRQTSTLLVDAAPVQPLGSGEGVAYNYADAEGKTYTISVPNYSGQRSVSIVVDGQTPEREVEILPPISNTRVLFNTETYAVRVFERQNRSQLYLNLYDRKLGRAELDGVPVQVIASGAETAYVFSNAGGDYRISEIASHPQRQINITYREGNATSVNETEIIPPIAGTLLLFDTETYSVRVYRREGQDPVYLNVYNRNTASTELLGVPATSVPLPQSGSARYMYEYDTIGYRITSSLPDSFYEILVYERIDNTEITKESTNVERTE